MEMKRQYNLKSTLKRQLSTLTNWKEHWLWSTIILHGLVITLAILAEMHSVIQ